MTSPEPPPEALAGKLLLADPGLRDPNFFRSVVYLTQHGEEGAHGFILNQPLGQNVDSLLSSEAFEPLAEVPVYQGGPVNTERLSFATVGWDDFEGALSFRSHLSTDDATEDFRLGKDVRAFIGYAGWSSGQVEGEIEEHAWIVQPVRPLLADPDLVSQLWPRCLREIGPFYEMVSHIPDSPESN